MLGLTSLGLITLYHFPYPEDSWPSRAIIAYLGSYAWAAGNVLARFDPTVSVTGLLIQGRFPVEIGASCDAGELLAVLLAAIVAFPSTWRRRFLGVAAGIAVVSGANLLRICSLYFIGVHSRRAFDLVHHDLWPPLMLVLTGAFFLVWATWAHRGPPRDSTPVAP
jgi:exosortase H (IPTLxxWG-CTERM-specific)